MGWRKTNASGLGVDLTALENEILSRGGTVDKAKQKATVQELVAGIQSIPIEGYGYPLNGATISEQVRMPTLNITEDFSITFKEATA